jgi:LacI family transcriptional regulator
MKYPRKHITIKEVAEKAGVSIQTVSRVLNDRPDVSAETRQNVQRVIDELGFKPYALARGLASRSNRTLGLFATDLSDYFFAEAVVGANAEALEAGYFFILGSTKLRREDEPRYLHLLTERHIDGVLFVRAGSEDDHEHLCRLYDTGIPVVTTGYQEAAVDFTLVDVKNQQGSHTGVKYLTELGHSQIAMITGPQHVKSSHDRNEGYAQALREAGIIPDPALLAFGDWTHASGYRAMHTILESRQPFTALFAHNDRMAIGAISALAEVGRKVPDDVSVIGFDDIPEATYTNPPLTTIRQPLQEVGRTAARLLIQRVENPSIGPTQVLLDTELILRSSCTRR